MNEKTGEIMSDEVTVKVNLGIIEDLMRALTHSGNSMLKLSKTGKAALANRRKHWEEGPACTICGKKMSPYGRGDRKYCTDRCRQQAFQQRKKEGAHGKDTKEDKVEGVEG